MGDTFKDNLRRIRTNQNLNQTELAKKINVKQGTISSWESGRTEPSMGDIARLAKALECSQEDLIGIKREVGDITFQDILIKINALDIEELSQLDEAIKHRIKVNQEIIMLEEIKARQEKEIEEQQNRIQEYAKRLAELKKEAGKNT